MLEPRDVPAYVNVSALTYSGVAEGSTSGFQLTRDGDLTDELLVHVSFGGNATRGTDFTAATEPGDVVRFAPNSPNAALAVAVLRDNTPDEYGESIDVTLDYSADYEVGSGWATLTITDDPPIITVAAGSIREGESGTVTFTRSGGDITAALPFTYSVYGNNATPGTDFTGLSGSGVFAANDPTLVVNVEALRDNDEEFNDTADIVVTFGTYTSLATLTITDDPPIISVTASDAVEGTEGGFTFTRSGGNIAAALTVSYDVNLWGASSDDFSGSLGSVTFAATVQTVFVPVQVLRDNEVEAYEAIEVVINGSSYSTATMTITDDPPVVTVTAADTVEGGTAGGFTFTRSGGNMAQALTVAFDVSGTASAGTDYDGIGTSVSFAPDGPTAFVAVGRPDDLRYYAPQSVDLTIQSSMSYVVGGVSMLSVTISDDELSPMYWIGGYEASWTDGSSWTGGLVPDQTSAVYFDGSYSNYGVTTPGLSGGLTLAEIHFVNGYSGTVTLASNLTVGKLELASANATLDQPTATYGSNVTVTTAMLWTGGTLNSSSNLANVTITGGTATAMFAPAGGGTVNLGSTINLSGGAVGTIKEGTLNVTNDGMQINVNTGSVLNVSPILNGIATIAGTFSPHIQIKPNASFTINSGHLFTNARLTNEGTFTLKADTSAKFPGQTGIAAAYSQKAGGATYLYGGSILDTGLLRNVVIEGGILATVSDDPDGYGIGNSTAYISTNKLMVDGGDIYINYGAAAHVSFGRLDISGDVIWAGGNYHPYIWGDVNDGDADMWYASGSFVIGGTAAVAPVSIADEWTPTPPTFGYAWAVIQALGNLTVANGSPTVDGQVWEIMLNENAKTLKVKAK